MRLEQYGRRRRYENEAGDALAPMPGDVAYRLAARHRMGDEGEAGQIEVFDERRDVVGERVEVVAAGGLIGAAVTAPVEADAAEAFVREGGRLVVPHSAIAAEAAQEQDRAAFSPLAPEESSAVFRRDEGHGICPLLKTVWGGAGLTRERTDGQPGCARRHRRSGIRGRPPAQSRCRQAASPSGTSRRRRGGGRSGRRDSERPLAPSFFQALRG